MAHFTFLQVIDASHAAARRPEVAASGKGSPDIIRAPSIERQRNACVSNIELRTATGTPNFYDPPSCVRNAAAWWAAVTRAGSDNEEERSGQYR